MKFQKVQNKIQGKWTYQAQFFDNKKAQEASQWLSGRLSSDYKVGGSFVSTNDLQVIFELRMFFEPNIKILQVFEP
jgi:hypothetical protein